MEDILGTQKYRKYNTKTRPKNANTKMPETVHGQVPLKSLVVQLVQAKSSKITSTWKEVLETMYNHKYTCHKMYLDRLLYVGQFQNLIAHFVDSEAEN